MLTRFDDLCQRVVDNGYDVDVNLMAAVVLGVSASQSIVVASPYVSFVGQALALIGTNVLGVSVCSISCTPQTTWEDMARNIISTGKVPQIVVFKNLDFATQRLQLSLLSALANREVRINNTVHPFPPFFLSISVISSLDSIELINKHLKEHFYLWHLYEGHHDETLLPALRINQLVTNDYFKLMGYRAQQLKIMIDVKRYMQDIVIFLRTHRLVRGGVSSKACKDLDNLVRAMSVMQNFEFATPSIVAMAARKVFPLKITLCDPTDEPTLHYGGDIKILTEWMATWDHESIIDNVLETVDPPL